MNTLVKVARDGSVAILMIDNPPVNALSSGVSKAIFEAVTAAATDDSIQALVVIDAGGTFTGGHFVKLGGAWRVERPGTRSTSSVIRVASSRMFVPSFQRNESL